MAPTLATTAGRGERGDVVIPATSLDAVPRSPGDDSAPRITPLAGGLVNRSYLVETGAGRFVLRLNAPSGISVALGVDRALELEAQRLAAAAGLAPRVVATADDYSYLVTPFVAGARMSAATLDSRDGLRRLGLTLASLRPLSVEALRGASASMSLIDRARRLVARARVGATRERSAALGRGLDAAERGWELAGGGRRVACLVHSDPNPDNVVAVPGEGPCMLLDWEYAHAGDPLQDPAAWLQASGSRWPERVPNVWRACALQGLADERMLAGMVAVYDALALAWQALAATAAGIPGAGRAN